MLLAVEGGGFFSSSATGYSKGLSLLFLGQKKEDKSKPMRVLPRNQYQLVDKALQSLSYGNGPGRFMAKWNQSLSGSSGVGEVAVTPLLERPTTTTTTTTPEVNLLAVDYIDFEPFLV
uniref:Cyclic nucleotide-binding domain-containing protein n=1 Tax=Kalanchoe fedtschenkoi TaxID=63787 RepID=A0A7N0VKX0_KALFE